MPQPDQLKFAWDFCGQKRVTQFLQQAIVNHRLNHAYIFHGPDHLGKTTLANIFINSIFCSQTAKSIIPCRDCSTCQQITNGLHPDIFQVKRTVNDKTGKLNKNISTEQIRDLKMKLSQASLLSGYKAAIIQQAELINLNGANALLKLLEEPTAKTVIIISTNNLNSLPATIISRSQVLKFLPVATKQIQEYLALKQLADSQTLARVSLGRPGLALSYSQQPEKMAVFQQDIALFFHIMPAQINHRFQYLQELKWHKDEAENLNQLSRILIHWQIALRDIYLYMNDNQSLLTNYQQEAVLSRLSQDWDSARIYTIGQAFKQAYAYLQRNISAKNILENLILNL